MKTSAPLCLLLLGLFLCSLFLSNSDARRWWAKRRFIRREGKKEPGQGRRSYNNNRHSGRDSGFFRELHSKYEHMLLAFTTKQPINFVLERFLLEVESNSHLQFGFALLRLVTGLNISRHFLIQSEVKPLNQSRLAHTRFLAFHGAGFMYLVRSLVSLSDWFASLSVIALRDWPAECSYEIKLC